MAEETFGGLDRMLETGDASACLAYLANEFRQAKQYRLLFEARLMQKRLELGLPLIQGDPPSELPDPSRASYERAMMDAARETGGGFLADGDIENAWPYFRAIGEPEPVAAAIERVEPREEMDGVIAIAFEQGVHPAKGLELILQKYGMCRAITSFGMYPVQKDRLECIALLAEGLHHEILERMAYAVEQREGKRPETTSIREMMADRDWLFGDYDYYVDTSHLSSVLQYTLDVTDEKILEMFVEFCDYGRRLSTQFQFRSEPPFDQPYVDYGYYAQALLGQNVDAAVEHFRSKAAAADPEQAGTAPAQVLVNLLVRLRRYSDALEVALEYLPNASASELACPSALQLCHMAKDYGRLLELARERGDLLSYAAASLERKNSSA